MRRTPLSRSQRLTDSDAAPTAAQRLLGRELEHLVERVGARDGGGHAQQGLAVGAGPAVDRCVRVARVSGARDTAPLSVRRKGMRIHPLGIGA